MLLLLLLPHFFCVCDREPIARADFFTSTNSLLHMQIRHLFIYYDFFPLCSAWPSIVDESDREQKNAKRMEVKEKEKEK